MHFIRRRAQNKLQNRMFAPLMAGPAGFAPATGGLTDHCSAGLSYSPIEVSEVFLLLTFYIYYTIILKRFQVLNFKFSYT